MNWIPHEFKFPRIEAKKKSEELGKKPGEFWCGLLKSQNLQTRSKLTGFKSLTSHQLTSHSWTTKTCDVVSLFLIKNVWWW